MWELLGYRLAQSISLFFPGVSYFIADCLADAHFIFSHRDRNSVIQNLRTIYGPVGKRELRREARKVFHQFGRYLVEFLRFPVLDRQAFSKGVEVEGLEHLESALKRGKGVIGVSAHYGNWELGAAGLSLLGYPIHAVVLAHSNPAVNRFFIQMRVQKRIRVIPIGQPVWETLDCLSKNEILLMAGDRDFSANGVEIFFFNRPSHFPKGPAALSLRSGSPVVIAFLVREEDGRLRLFFEPPIFPKEDGSFRENLLSMTQEIAHRLEQQIRKDPSQWVIFEPFWDKQQGNR